MYSLQAQKPQNKEKKNFERMATIWHSELQYPSIHYHILTNDINVKPLQLRQVHTCIITFHRSPVAT